MKRVQKYLPIILTMGMAFKFIGGAIVSAQGFSDQTMNSQRKQVVTTLLGQLRAASEREVREGQTTVDEHGQRLFVGETATRVKILHDETVKRIDELSARPEVQRQVAIASAAAFIADPSIAKALARSKAKTAVKYKHTTKSPYNEAVPVEVYQIGTAQFEINALNDKIIQFGPRPLTDTGKSPSAFDLTQRFRQAELLGQARRFVVRHSGSINLDALVAKVNDKEGLVYFFRWEDGSREVDGVHPFVQVGITIAGEIVSYTNTMDLPDSPAPYSIARGRKESAANFLPISYVSPMSRAAALIAGVYNFSNNGNYYTEYGPAAYWWTVWNEGFCGRYGSCPPPYMKYTYESSNLSNYARWQHFGYESGAGTHYVFIPRINATTRQASYQIVYNGGSTYSFSIDQLAWSDVFVKTSSTPFYAMGATWLYDTTWGTPAGKKIGFDEVRIIY